MMYDLMREMNQWRRDPIPSAPPNEEPPVNDPIPGEPPEEVPMIKDPIPEAPPKENPPPQDPKVVGFL